MPQTNYRELLKRYMAEVLDDDHVVAPNAIYYVSEADKLELVAIGREIAIERDNGLLKHIVDTTFPANS
jgi:hypothetical protein